MLNAAMMIFIETVKAMLLKIAFKKVAERFAERVFLWAGDKIVSMTTNTLDDKTWLDIKNSMTGKQLEVIEQKQKEFRASSEDWTE